MKIAAFLRETPLSILLLALPLAILAKYSAWGPLWVFALSALGVVPMAQYIGLATESLASITGPRVGGLLNATLGNAAELIITIMAIREGLLELVKASITGSILGNLLLVLGMSMVLGGTRNGRQTFNQRQASNNAILLALAVIALLVPSLLSNSIGTDNSPEVEALSLGVAVVMIVLYALGILYSFVTDSGPESAISMEASSSGQHASQHHAPDWAARAALIVLALSTAGVAYLSELLVGAVEPVVSSLGVSEFFLGIILIPLVGNVAEHLVAVKMAMQNQMDLSVEISVASSLQIALFVAPVLVFVSLLLGHRLQLIFNQFELLALVAGVLIAALVSADGESNWLEGAELLAVYLILGLAFFLLPLP
ncbi:MAG: calcium/proton exchanger [Anaerolineales bacterium]|jgi:Ca2+:H+ antiporter